MPRHQQSRSRSLVWVAEIQVSDDAIGLAPDVALVDLDQRGLWRCWTGCVSLISGWRTKMISDHKLRQDVIDELDFEPSVDAAHIGVGVHDGVVTLTGFVASYADKVAAERAARRVFGVKAIAQEIEL